MTKYPEVPSDKYELIFEDMIIDIYIIDHNRCRVNKKKFV